MVIEDHFILPANISIVEEEHGSYLPSGYYRGDYLLKNEKGETLITYEKPVYIDAKVLGMHGIYNLLKTGNDYTLQTLVPVEWLAKTDNTYPLMLDPSVYGATKIGDFTQTGLPSASMAFTSMNLGSCDYHMNVTVPGESELGRVLVDMEYSLTYDNTCGTPPLPPPFCTFNQVTMQVHSDDCNTNTSLLSCNPANPPYTGTCTTDSNLVAGANAILVNSAVPNYLSSLPPQCPDYHLAFTLHNRDSICGDVCGYLCARGNMWRMTVEANRVDGFITQDKTETCSGQAVTFTAHPNYGVPPYSYAWTTDGGHTFDTIYNAPDFIIHPQFAANVFCQIIDACSIISWETNSLDVSIYSASSITVSNDTLFALGSTNVQWYLNNNLLPGDTNQFIEITQAGTYSITHSSDSHGCTSSLPVTIDCAAQFIILNADSFPFLPGLDSGYYYGVNASTSVGGIQNYLWDFGDGATSTDPYPTHTYVQPGHYTVCLTVSNFLCTNTHCDSSFYVFNTEGGLMTKLIIQSPNGINELSRDAVIKVFPNPATNELNITTGGKPIEEFRIFGVDGKLALSIRQPTSNRFDIKQLSTGVYIAEVKLKGITTKVRWVKM